jgi:hypothetical protein
MAQSAVSPDSTLVVYLRGASQPAGPIRYMKAELETIMRGAGFQVEWSGANQKVDAPFLVVVDFSGSCTPGPASILPENTSLAFTSVTDGHVLPFSTINCTALTGAVGPARENTYGRAMARVLAHELYHALTQTTAHGRAGIAKTCFSPADLLSSRFQFEGTALAQLRTLLPAPAASSDFSSGDEATGR